jgi:hypothetical protein
MATRVVSLVATLLAASVATVASAQVVGEFRWQTQPYCNVLTLMVVQQGAQFHLSGSDDLCGAGSAPVTGTAVATGGAVAIGVTIALPSGAPAHLTASIALANVSGTWNDADGHTGPFAFNAATGGASRPAPARAAAIAATQLAPTIFSGTGAATTIARSDHDHDDRYAGRLVRLQVSPWDLAQRAVGTNLGLSSVAGCATTPAFVANPMIMPLPIPSGAEVRSAVVTVLFGGTVSLIAEAVGANGMGAPTTLASATSTDSNGTVTHTLTPSSPFVVQPGTTLRLDYIRGITLGGSVCSVELLYVLPAVD